MGKKSHMETLWFKRNLYDVAKKISLFFVIISCLLNFTVYPPFF